MIERELIVNFRVTQEEHTKLKTLADDEGEHMSMLLRRWIRQRYEARFGEAAPRLAKAGRR